MQNLTEPPVIWERLGDDDLWSDWVPLRGAGANPAVSRQPGLYRIRRCGEDALDYVGQTGNSLRARLTMLNGCFKEVMPYNDPHTAAPALWALLHAGSGELEVSTVLVDGTAPIRKAAEAVAISLHRLRFDRSPSFNFGRMPTGYRKSSGNNQRLVAAGKRFRGGYDPEVPLPVPHLPVQGSLTSDDVTSSSWVGVEWSTWWSPADGPLPLGLGTGVYRLRVASAGRLAYIGQGSIGDRVRAHLKKGLDPSHRQYGAFGGDVEVSWAARPMPATQLLELENDLIAAHVLGTRTIPLGQYLG